MKRTIHITYAVAIVAVLGAGTVSADVGYLDEYGIVAWGANDYGQVGDAPTETGFSAVAAGGAHGLALRTDGTIAAWGANDYTQVSDAPTETGFSAVAAGGPHGLALRTDGTIAAWGWDAFGQVSNTPTGTGFTAIAAGGRHGLALKTDGSLVSWGYDGYGLVSDTPTGTGFVAVSAEGYNSLALKADGSLVSWGRNDEGQVTEAPVGIGFTAVAAGYYHGLALKIDKSLVSWGTDDSGDIISDTPTGTGFVAVSAGRYSSLALKADGSLVSWGRNDGDVVTYTPIAGHFLEIAVGGSYCLALKAGQEYGELLVTGADARALLQRNVSVSGDCAVETMLNGENASRMDVAGALVLEPGANFSGTGEIDAETIELSGCQVSANLAEACGLENHGQVSGHGAIATDFHGTSSSSVTVDGGMLTMGDPSSYGSFLTAGKLYVGGNTAVLLTKGFAGLGLLTELSGGTLSATNGITFGTGDNLAGSGSVDAKVSAGFGSTIEATGDLSLGDANSYDGFFSDGSLLTGVYTVTVNDRNVAVLGSLTELGDGVDGGTLTAGNPSSSDTYSQFLLEQGKNMVGRGYVNGHYKNHGDVIGDGSALAERIVFNSPWVVSGKGAFTRTLVLGTFAPGDSPTVSNGTEQAFGGTVQIELGGTTPGSGDDNHDQINDSLAILLVNSPTLEILPWNNFVPEVGDEFVILTWQDGLAGAFGNMLVDSWFTDNGLNFEPHYNNIGGAGNLTIEATPEPATLSILALGGLALVRRRKRRVCK